ncbi:hypothetical protein Slin15195_G101600 [Septoria linicola]|uniref:Uncharacterized protein n=1 Tax=Septoria linicola TaxID=215465 RepID=A0A9Q9B431_9PEZI|nr:hypothetical protein Slin15195_G101600 [Septoria linicola]
MAKTTVLMSPTGANTLRMRLESLPQELYNRIYDQVFTAACSIVVVAREGTRKAEYLLQVDRVSRAQYAKSYYGNTKFVFPTAIQDLVPWLRRMSRSELHLISDMAIEWRDLPPVRTLERERYVEIVRKIIDRETGSLVNSNLDVILSSELEAQLGSEYKASMMRQ